MKKKKMVLFIGLLGGIGFLTAMSYMIKQEEAEEIKADTKTNFYQVWDNFSKYFCDEEDQEQTAPTGQPITEKFDNIELMKQAELNLGEYVETLGYYQQGDEGGGIFYIDKKKKLKDNGGTVIYLDNGLVANLVLENKTVSIKQFGAKTSNDFDNAEVFNRAFASEANNIEFPKGEYKVKNKFEIQSSNLNILGNDSVIYVDNDYKEYEGYGECLMNISKVKNVSIDGLKFDFRQTKRNASGKQFEISFAKNITITNCEFNIPDTIYADEENKEEIRKSSSYCNGSLWTAWENITIKDCKFIQLGDTDVGGCIGINDYYGKGCSNVVFENNICEYTGHDECIAIFSKGSETIKGIEIKNNTITALPSDSSVPSTMCFSIGYSDSRIEDVKIIGNTIKGYADFAFMTIGNAKNVTVEENKLTYLKVTKKCAPVMFRTEVKSYDHNIIIKKNDIYIQQEIEDTIGMGGICEGKIKFLENKVTYDVYGYTLFSKDADVQNNKIYLNKGGNELGAEIKNFEKNTVVLDGKTQYLFKFQDKKLETDVCIKENEIFYNYAGTEGNENVLLLAGITLNDKKFTFKKNIIHTMEGTADKYLYSINIRDKTAQTIEISDNITGSFKNIEILKCNLNNHQVTIENNN